MWNETGWGNSFFGVRAGLNNTIGDGKTFLGAYSDLNPGPEPETSPVSNATALGYGSYVSQSNSLVLGSINGVNGATEDVDVGIGTTAPQSALHIKRSDGTARLLVEETLTPQADREMYSLRNYGGVQFDMENTFLD
jgi:hypothetical protein